MNSKKSYIITILNEDNEEDVIEYPAYSEEQASYLIQETKGVILILHIELGVASLC